MSARESQKTGRLRLRHLMEATEARGEEMTADRQRFQGLAREDAAPRVVSSFNLFQTPEPLAQRLVELAGEGHDLGRVLEPSAGLGRLYKAVRKVSACRMVLVEIAADCARELYLSTNGDENVNLVQNDFLLVRADESYLWRGDKKIGDGDDGCIILGRFNTIVMNPPFKQGTDIKHIRNAMTLLAPEGRLVSLCANGPRQRSQLMPLASTWIDLPAGSFKGEGTNVNAAIMIVNLT